MYRCIHPRISPVKSAQTLHAYIPYPRYSHIPSIHPPTRTIHSYPAPSFASCQSLHIARTTSAFIFYSRHSLSVLLPFYIHARSSDRIDFDIASIYDTDDKEPEHERKCIIYLVANRNCFWPLFRCALGGAALSVTFFVFTAMHWPFHWCNKIRRIYST